MRSFCPHPYYILNEKKGKNLGEHLALAEREPHTPC